MSSKISRNYFTNINALHWLAWMKVKSDNLPVLAFYFLSRKNATSARYLPLLNQMEKIRIVVVNGTRFGKFDFFQLKLFKVFIKLTQYKQVKYEWIMVTDTGVAKKSSNQILNIDDPLYTQEEIMKIKNWEIKLKEGNKKSVIIVTNHTTEKYLLDSGIQSKVFIIEQGHSKNYNTRTEKFEDFTFVYSSPYIHVCGDKHANHPTWGVNLFIKNIIPELIKNDPLISIHLIGHMGKNARKFLNKFDQVTMHGYKTIEENYELLKKCNVALYPRTIDNKRRVLKIYEYIGANLPIIAFDLEDTKPVKEFNVGLSVETIAEFVLAVLRIKNDEELYSNFQKNLISIQNEYSWESLADKYDNLITNNFD